MHATHPLTSAASPLRLSSIGAGEVEVAMLSDCDCDFSGTAVVESGADVITAIKLLREGGCKLVVSLRASTTWSEDWSTEEQCDAMRSIDDGLHAPLGKKVETACATRVDSQTQQQRVATKWL